MRRYDELLGAVNIPSTSQPKREPVTLIRTAVQFKRLTAHIGASIVLLVGLIHSPGCMSNHEVSSSGSSPASGAPAIVLQAQLPKETFRLGEPILLSCSLRNQSQRNVTVWASGVWPNNRVEIKTASGVEPPLTAAGREQRAAFAPDGGRDKNVPHELKPGEVYPDLSEVDLSTLYERLAVGRYTVEVTYDDAQPPTPLRAVSTPVAFEVK